jgi:Pyruvate/2-oxoacid:ferredoxin oxidoreductase delta subunit
MTNASVLQIVLYEGAGSRALPNRFAVTRALLERGYPVIGARGRRSPRPGPSAGTLLVLGRFIEQSPPQAEAPDASCTVVFRDVDGLDHDGVLHLVDDVRCETAALKPGGWKPWFPVIDYSRCTNCMQCLTFCLFDVYGVSKEQKIQVQHASNCKTDCPACSRVCPEVAILFPKYKAGPINGAEVNPEDVQREKLKVDISALLGGDIYAALRQRSEHARSRFGKERADKRALDERKKCLVKLQQDLAIPPEVLAALPTFDEIREKTARAIAAADAQSS